MKKTRSSKSTSGVRSEDTAKVTQSIAISTLSRDPVYQVRKKLDEATLKRYVGVYKSGKEMPPVTVAVVNGVPVLIDGWHRVAAQQRLDRGEVEAEVSTMTRAQALWAAAQANLEHGKPLTPSERKEVYKRFMKTRQHLRPDGSLLSYREIGLELGYGHTTIRNWEIKHFPAVAHQRSGEDFRAFPEAEPLEKQLAEVKQVKDALHKLQEAFERSSDAEVRGEIIELADLILKRMKDAGNWSLPMF